MDPISATVAAIVTSVLTKGVEKLGAAASSAAQTIAETVLDRLRRDPDEKRTIERYEADPVEQQNSLKAAIDQLVATDAEFATRLETLVQSYETAAGTSVQARDVEQLTVGNDNIVVRDNTGTIDARRSSG